MMRLSQLPALLIVSGFCFSPVARSEDEPQWKKDSAFVLRERDPASDLWIDAFGWVQTGKNLAAAEQLALAQGSFIQALRKFERLAKAYPDFESELVAFRIESLGEEIRAVEERLGSDEHEVMMQYLDFVESVETAYELRQRSEYKPALDAFGLAQNLMDDLIASRPEEFRAAVDSQYRRVEDSIAWISNYLDLTQPRVFSAALDDSTDWGTTRFVKNEDLPAAPEAELSSVLFPEAAATALEPILPRSGSLDKPDTEAGREKATGEKPTESGEVSIDAIRAYPGSPAKSAGPESSRKRHAEQPG